MASLSTHLVPIINELLIKEIGEANIPPLDWKQVGEDNYKFLVDIGDYTEVVNVNFERIDKLNREFYLPHKYRNLKYVYNVGYDVSGIEVQFSKSNLKTLLTIISTIVDIVKDFIEKNDIDGLHIKGTSKSFDSLDISQKSNLYQAYIKSQLKTIPGYGYDTYRNGYIIIKK
jgi:hypothetical protein